MHTQRSEGVRSESVLNSEVLTIFTHPVGEENDDTAHKRNCCHGSSEMIIKSFVCHGQAFRYAL